MNAEGSSDEGYHYPEDMNAIAGSGADQPAGEVPPSLPPRQKGPASADQEAPVPPPRVASSMSTHSGRKDKSL